MVSFLSHAQYSMVLVSCIAVLILAAGILIYKKIYPQKRINLFILLVLISILPLISIFRAGSYQSGDLSLHVKYAMPFYENIIQGNFIPQWSANDCSNYGCPEHLFLFLLPYYLISLFHGLGFSFILSVKLLLVSSFLASGIGMYLWIKDEFGKLPGFVAAIFYLFAPYHLIDLHFRVSIGEVVSFGIIPYIFFFLKKYLHTNKYSYLFLTSLFLALLIISHQVTALFSFPIIFIYGILLIVKQKTSLYQSILKLILPFFLSLLLSLFYWFPIFSLGKYIQYTQNTDFSYLPFKTYIYAPVRLGFLFQGHKGELYPVVGYIQWIMIFITLLFLIKNKLKGFEKTIIIFFVSIFIFYFIIMQQFSHIFWDTFTFFKNIEFTYRLSIELTLAISVITAIIAKNISSKKLIYVICLIAICSTILNWGNRQNTPNVNDATLKAQPIFKERPGFTEVSTPIWVDRNAGWIGKPFKHPIEVLSGSAEILPVYRNSTEHIYHINVIKDAFLKENTYYFPGWKLYVNGIESPINYNYKPFNGVITFKLKKGVYTVKLNYQPVLISVFTQIISLFTFVILLFVFALSKLMKFKAIKRKYNLLYKKLFS
jgi:hypothetical protein